MKSITIHGIDSELDKKISGKSREYGFSLEERIKDFEEVNESDWKK